MVRAALVRALAVCAAVSLLAAACIDQPAHNALPTDEQLPGATPLTYGVWLGLSPSRANEVHEFEAFLSRAHVSGILPAQQLLRSESSWAKCGGSPFVLPPRAVWPNIVGTLVFIRDFVVPQIGPVEVESGYRDPAMNACAGGAKQSAHMGFWALDLVPTSAIAREQMIPRLCAVHAAHGPAGKIGLGFYDGRRFHVDSWGFRRWGADRHGASSPCNGVSNT